MWAAGTEVCWLVDAESRTVEVFKATRDALPFSEADVITSPSLPGFSLNVGALFAVLDDVD
jgi:Uma2 family endonuclease